MSTAETQRSAPKPFQVTPYSLARRYVDAVQELPGGIDHPLIRWWLSLCGFGLQAHDEIAWCGAFVRGITWQLGIPGPVFPARARHWLTVGTAIATRDAQPGFDLAIVERGGTIAPPSELNAPGHVGFFAGIDTDGIHLLGGNQSDRVSIAAFHPSRVLGIRRLA